jgi:[ribosomal protein S5]-alanine N-acetyltransferase
MGYDLKEEFWGQGYMQEAVGAILDFAEKEMKIKEVCACIYVENESSKRLAEKLGFVASGSKFEIFRGKEYLHDIYSRR